MKAGVIRIKWLPRRRGSSNRQRFISIEGRGTILGLFAPDQNEFDCIIELLLQLDASKISMDLQDFPSGYAPIEDGWREDADEKWVVQGPGIHAAITNVIHKAEQEDITLEMGILLANGERVSATINDNSEYWYLIGSEGVFNDNWIGKCKCVLPQWRFIIK